MEGKKLKSFAELREGHKIIIVSNSNAHNYPMNQIVTVKRDGARHTDQMSDAIREKQCNTLNIKDVLLMTLTVADLYNEKKNVEAKVAELDEQIKLCEDLKLENYDESLIKVIQAIRSMRGVKTDVEKAKILLEVMKTEYVD